MRGGRDQRRRLHALLVGDPRRALGLRRPRRGGAPLEPRRPRAVAAHIGDLARRHGLHRRLRWSRLRARCSRRARADRLMTHPALVRLPPMRVAARADALRAALGDGEHACDALLVSKLVNIRYLTGFTGSAALLLVLPDRLLFVTDGRYEDQAADELAAAGVDAEVRIGLTSQGQ